jgi:hypothetical protein
MATLDAETRLKQIGRNDDCSCGSGKKYKKCHLREDEETVSKALAAHNSAAAKAAEKEADAEGHVHGPDCEHDETETAKKPKFITPQVSSFAGQKQSKAAKAVNTPRKAV